MRKSPFLKALRLASTGIDCILSGTGLYTDDGKTYEVHAGDTTYCADGHCHGLENTGDGDLKFMALIIPS